MVLPNMRELFKYIKAGGYVLIVGMGHVIFFTAFTLLSPAVCSFNFVCGLYFMMPLEPSLTA